MAEAGRRIGPYRLLSVLGRGAMGEVWRARDERLDRLVALKLLPRDQKSNAERRARMLREAKASASIPHPGVVTLYDIVEDEGDDVLVLELVDGVTLADHVEDKGPLETGAALSVLVELCNALAAAHDKGILHRDVKTANVMLAKTGEIKVLDFGLAKLRESAPIAAGSPAPRPSDVAASPEEIALDQTISTVDDREMSDSGPDELLRTRAGQILGTPLYMAPEQFAGEAPTAKSEVFAVGVVAYELLSGAPPFVSDTYEDLQEKVFTHEVPALSGEVSKDLTDVINRALAKDPDDRFESMSALGAAFKEIQTARNRPKVLAKRIALAALFGVLALALIVVMTRGENAAPSAPELGPGDSYVAQALDEYNLFYNQKAAASIRAAIREAPDHPLAYAYAILFPTESGAELDRMVAEAARLKARDSLPARQRGLLEAAIALAERGPEAARKVLDATGERDGEIVFWLAELAYRARDYEAARAGYADALETSDSSFSGRIYDHYSAVLSYLGRYEEAEEIGHLYAKAFSGEPDAIGVYATTLAGVGKLDEALASAEEAHRLYRGEDTVAGLAKIHALRGELDEARKLYAKSAAMAPDSRRPIRNAALGYLAWLAEDDEPAREAVADCLPGGDDDEIWQRSQCLWVAGTIWPEKTDIAIAELDKLASAGTKLRPAYGSPTSLANLLRARQLRFSGACKRTPEPKELSEESERKRAELLGGPPDFYATYHIPFFADYAKCELR